MLQVASEALTSARAHLDPAALRVADERGGRVEAHRLLVEQRAQELGGVVPAQPGALVGQEAEGRRVRLGEAELGERHDLLEHASCDRLVDPAAARAVAEGVPVRHHRLARAPPAHRTAQALGLALREARERDGDVEHLILVDDHAERVGERLRQQRVVVGHAIGRVVPDRLAPLEVGVHGAALDGPRAHERDLDREVLEVLGPRAQQHLHLGARLDLEHPDGVGGLDLGIRAGVVERGAGEVDRLAARAGDEVDAALDGAQHAQAEQVDLEEARIGAGVLVPLADLATLHGRRHERDEVGQRARRDDHPAGVLREVARQAGDLAAEVRERAEAAVVGALADAVHLRELLAHALGTPAVGAPRQPLEVGRRQPQRLAELADGAARAIGRERRDQRAALAAEAIVHRQDQLLADVAREVEVDVGHGCQLAVEEAPEREPRRDRIDVRETGQVADDRAHRRASPPARRQRHAGRVRPSHGDRDLACDLEDLAVQQEEAREPVVADQRELLVEPGARLAAVCEAAVAALQLERADLRQLGVGHRVVGRRVAVAEILREVEAQSLGQLDRLAGRLGQVAEQERHLARALEHVLAIAASLGLAGLERQMRADGDERILERAPAPARARARRWWRRAAGRRGARSRSGAGCGRDRRATAAVAARRAGWRGRTPRRASGSAPARRARRDARARPGARSPSGRRAPRRARTARPAGCAGRGGRARARPSAAARGCCSPCASRRAA